MVRPSAGSVGLLVLVALGALAAAAPPVIRGRAMVVADHVEASRAGAEVLRLGGNAVDAAVATALSAGVVQPSASGLGGGGFAVVVLPDGTRAAVDFREVAPGAATRDRFAAAGVAADASRKGPFAVAVPAESRGLAWLLRTFGTLSPRQVAAPAIRQARRGFPLGPWMANSVGRTKDGEVRALFSAVDLQPGTTVRRKALAATLTRWAATDGEDLHVGRGARAVVEEVGGAVSLEDLAAYQVVRRDPIVVTWRGRTIVTMPPPSSGGVVLSQVLKVLEGEDLAALGHNSAAYVHRVSEALRHGFADRAQHLGDPAFSDVPTERLLSDARIAEIRAAFDPERSFPPEAYGTLVQPPTDAGTQHLSVVDRQGGAVALTTTINTDFGSGLVVESLGLILNNQMDDFAAAPGVPNRYGLVGSERNAIEPGKRPLSSMTPTVVLAPDGSVELVIGASGGSFIISSTLQALLNVLVFDMDPAEAVAAPRFHHQWLPDELILDPGFPEDVARALEARGHHVRRQKTRRVCEEAGNPFFDCFRASVQAVWVNGETRLGGADPVKGGAPVGVW